MQAVARKANADRMAVMGANPAATLTESRADRCLLLQNGRLTAEGDPHTVLQRLRVEQMPT